MEKKNSGVYNILKCQEEAISPGLCLGVTVMCWHYDSP